MSPTLFLFSDNSSIRMQLTLCHILNHTHPIILIWQHLLHPYNWLLITLNYTWLYFLQPNPHSSSLLIILINLLLLPVNHTQTHTHPVTHTWHLLTLYYLLTLLITLLLALPPSPPSPSWWPQGRSFGRCDHGHPHRLCSALQRAGEQKKCGEWVILLLHHYEWVRISISISMSVYVLTLSRN